MSSSFELGAAQVGLAAPSRICQCQHAMMKIDSKEGMPLQIDGEVRMLLCCGCFVYIYFI